MAVRDEVASLPSMTLSELREVWAARFGAPPKQRSVELLRRVLAWRLQAEAFGGLDAATVRLLGSERISAHRLWLVAASFQASFHQFETI